MALTGVFFTPYAHPFKITGSGNMGQQSAQFVSQQLVVTGGGSLTMTPDPNNSISLPPKGGILIR